ncbi:MAG: ECF-type sigma factor [Planctomycetota bacterium]
MSEDVREILAAIEAGDESASRRLTPRLYEELRELAQRYMGRGGELTIQPTALVHEAFLKLVDHAVDDFNDQTHFRAVAATVMRQILIDHLRSRRAAKRGGGWERVTLSELSGASQDFDLEALDEALTDLAEMDERAAKVVELKFFGGLTEPAIAIALQVSERTVRNDWSMARAWLRQRLGD